MSDSPTIGAYDNVAGNYYDKYSTRNPISRRLMAGFLAAFDDLSRQSGARSAFEVGCGEGHLSMRLIGMGVDVRGCDIGGDVVSQANEVAEATGHGRPFHVQSIYELGPEASAELIVCCEVLEHLPVTADALDQLAAIARPHLLVSVPREPIWRILNTTRGKYWGALGNTPGHIQHWSSGGFVRLLETRFDILAVRSPLPWTMVLCRPREPRAARGKTAGGR